MSKEYTPEDLTRITLELVELAQTEEQVEYLTSREELKVIHNYDRQNMFTEGLKETIDRQKLEIRTLKDVIKMIAGKDDYDF